MSFFKLILKNPFRKKSNAALAILGITIAIMAIIVLGLFAGSMSAALEGTIHNAGSDFTITGTDDGDSAYGTSTIDASWQDKILKVEGVESIYSCYVIRDQLSSSIAIGLNTSNMSADDLSLTKGRMFDNNKSEVIMGKIAAESDNVSLNDEVDLFGKKFKVVGIYESGKQENDLSTYTSIEDVQNIMDDPGDVSNIYVKVADGYDVQKVANSINDKYGDDIKAVTSVRELGQMGQMLDMVDSASWAISLLAIIVGGLGIINTMLMSVLERTREIGVLKAVGWSNKRVLLMIIGESLTLTLISFVIGSIIACILMELLAPMIGFEVAYSLDIFVRALIVSIIVGILGGLYPAIKAVKLPPTEALRYE